MIDGTPEEVFAIALEADLVEAVRANPVVAALFSLRAAIERMVGLVTGRAPAPEEPWERMRLVDLPEHGEWVVLGRSPPREIAFGAIGRFWSGETRWETIDAADFAEFARRMKPRREVASFACTRHSPLIGVVLRSVLTLIARGRAKQRGPLLRSDHRADPVGDPDESARPG